MNKQVVSIKHNVLAAVLEYCLLEAADNNVDILTLANENEQALTVTEQVDEFSAILRAVRMLRGGEYILVPKD